MVRVLVRLRRGRQGRTALRVAGFARRASATAADGCGIACDPQRAERRLVIRALPAAYARGFVDRSAIDGPRPQLAPQRGLVALLIVLAALWRKLRLEERWMGETFTLDYQRYRARTAALIPFLL